MTRLFFCPLHANPVFRTFSTKFQIWNPPVVMLNKRDEVKSFSQSFEV